MLGGVHGLPRELYGARGNHVRGLKRFWKYHDDTSHSTSIRSRAKTNAIIWAPTFKDAPHATKLGSKIDIELGGWDLEKLMWRVWFSPTISLLRLSDVLYSASDN